jgi:hypothetical protein
MFVLCVLIAMKHFDPQPHEDEERSFMHIVESAYCRDVVSLCPNIHPAMRDVPIFRKHPKGDNGANVSTPSQARAVEWNKVWCPVGLGARSARESGSSGC